MLKKFFLLVLLIVGGLSVIAQQTWVERQHFRDPARLQAVGFSIGDKGYVATGTNGISGHLLQDLQEYDPATNNWEYKSNPPTSLRGSAVFTLGNKAYITTGADHTGMNNQLYVWDQPTDTWSTSSPFPAGQGRMAAVGISYGTRGFIATGFDLAERALNDIWEHNPFSRTWIRKASLPGSGRCYATGFAIHNKIYIGLGNNGTTYLKDWWEYDPATNDWRRMSDLPGDARTGAMGFVSNGKGYIVGGVNLDFKPLQDVWAYDPTLNTWEQVNLFPGAARGYGVGFNINTTGYIAAGTSTSGYLYELWECFPESMTQRLASYGPESNSDDLGSNVEDPLLSALQISPNPFFYRFALKMRHPYTGLLEITIHNMHGGVVFRRSFNKDEEFIVRCWEVDYLPDGLFIFKVKNASGTVDYKKTLIHKSFGI